MLNADRCKPGYRDLLAATLRAEPSAREMFRKLRNMKAKNMRCDYMLVRQEDGTYKECPDPAAWYAECDTVFGPMFVCMLRHGDNDWTLHS